MAYSDDDWSGCTLRESGRAEDSASSRRSEASTSAPEPRHRSGGRSDRPDAGDRSISTGTWIGSAVTVSRNHRIASSHRVADGPSPPARARDSWSVTTGPSQVNRDGSRDSPAVRSVYAAPSTPSPECCASTAPVSAATTRSSRSLPRREVDQPAVMAEERQIGHRAGPGAALHDRGHRSRDTDDLPYLIAAGPPRASTCYGSAGTPPPTLICSGRVDAVVGGRGPSVTPPSFAHRSNTFLFSMIDG